MTLLSAIFLVSCIGVGVGVTGYLPMVLRVEERLPIAAVVGAMAVTSTSFVAIAFFDFSGGAVVVGTGAAIVLAAPGWRSLAPTLRADITDFGRRLRAGWRDPASPAPLLGLLAVTWPLTIRILSLAYQRSPTGGVAVGHLSVFGDWQAHLAYAGSFAYGGDLDLTTPLSAGDDLAYHFGVDLFAALTVPAGLSVPAALTLTTGYLAFALPALLYMFGRRLFERRSVAVVGTITFLAAGGFGFFRFFDDVADQGWSVVWNLPRDYTRDFDTLWMDNPVLGHLYPQRPTLIGFSVVLIALVVLWSARRSGDRASMAWAGVLVGITPLFHTFGWGTALVLGSIWALTDAVAPNGAGWRHWLWYLVPATALALPTVVWLLPPESAFRWEWGWVAGDTPWDIVWFWLWNTGLFPLLFVGGLVWRGAVSRRVAVAVAPIWLWWAGVHFAIPHPWVGNNAKYAVFWWLIGSFVVAAVIVEAARWAARADPPVNAFANAAIALGALSLVAAGGLDIFKTLDGTAGVYPATVVTAGEQLVGEWARAATPADSVFVVSSSSTSQPISSIGGRPVVTAFDGWVFDLGLDWIGRAEASREILAGGPEAIGLVEEFGVDYVVIGPNELAAGADTVYWDRSGTLVYDLGGFRVYAVEGIV
ncbi:MAG: hypothetical protein OEU32_08620 [Acidimicrobiia bacterium]|nr:hypothetical protein [Acidimicrobiia bacterium]